MVNDPSIANGILPLADGTGIALRGKQIVIRLLCQSIRIKQARPVVVVSLAWSVKLLGSLASGVAPLRVMSSTASGQPRSCTPIRIELNLGQPTLAVRAKPGIDTILRVGRLNQASIGFTEVVHRAAPSQQLARYLQTGQSHRV